VVLELVLAKVYLLIFGVWEGVIDSDRVHWLYNWRLALSLAMCGEVIAICKT
jgi:hypothetical protein